VKDWNVTLEQTNKQTNKPQRNWTWRKLVEWVDGFQDNKTFVLFCFCFQFLWFQSIGANSVLIIFSLIPFIHFTICDFASFRLCLFTKLLMQRNNIWEWLENPLVFYCTTFQPLFEKQHIKRRREGGRNDNSVVLFVSLEKKKGLWSNDEGHAYTHTCTHTHTHSCTHILEHRVNFGDMNFQRGQQTKRAFSLLPPFFTSLSNL